jgi:hypothetical protein
MNARICSEFGAACNTWALPAISRRKPDPAQPSSTRLKEKEHAMKFVHYILDTWLCASLPSARRGSTFSAERLSPRRLDGRKRSLADQQSGGGALSQNDYLARRFLDGSSKQAEDQQDGPVAECHQAAGERNCL